MENVSMANVNVI